jgi:hypothetical protein
MSAVLPTVCAWCERVRDRAGRWERSDSEPYADQATHGICPECLAAQTREACLASECR